MSRRSAWRLTSGLAALLLPLISTVAGKDRTDRRVPGWGIDAVLSNHIPPEAFDDYIELLRTSRIEWIRERGTGEMIDHGDADRALDTTHRRTWRKLKAAGFRVVAFSSSLRPLTVEQRGNQLPENLIEVYDSARELGFHTLGEVDAFEMVGEPDAKYCRDLPERVAAFQKAVYLGIKDGAVDALMQSPNASSHAPLDWLQSNRAQARNSIVADSRIPIVLMGALAFPPGTWMDLAAANGLYDYTDAVNFHHYGFAADLAASIEAHRAFAEAWTDRGELPVWITEAGLNNISPSGWNNEEERRAQAEYLMTCARAAMDAGVVVFMPFILVHENDPFAMTETASRVFQSWSDYRDLTLREKLNPSRALVNPPKDPARVVLQWLPDNASCRPYKPGGIYWFRGHQPIQGTVWIYHFSDSPTDVVLRQTGGPGIRSDETLPEWRVSVPAGGRIGIPLTFHPPPSGTYQRTTYQFAAFDASSRSKDSAPLTQLEFRIGTSPTAAIARELHPIPFASTSPQSYISAESGLPETTGFQAPWTGWNGVRLDLPNATSPSIREFLVRVERPGPLHPPMLAAAVNGLPGTVDRGFLALRLTNSVGQPIPARVDLISADGQRFSVVEDLGRPRDDLLNPEVILAYADFHPWVFGRTIPGIRFDPAEIREIQIRFYDGHGGAKRVFMKLDAGEFIATAE